MRLPHPLDRVRDQVKKDHAKADGCCRDFRQAGGPLGDYWRGQRDALAGVLKHIDDLIAKDDDHL
jgi:hypothetical protein